MHGFYIHSVSASVDLHAMQLRGLVCSQELSRGGLSLHAIRISRLAKARVAVSEACYASRIGWKPERRIGSRGGKETTPMVISGTRVQMGFPDITRILSKSRTLGLDCKLDCMWFEGFERCLRHHTKCATMFGNVTALSIDCVCARAKPQVPFATC